MQGLPFLFGSFFVPAHSAGVCSGSPSWLSPWPAGSAVSGVVVICTSRSAAIYTTMVLPASTMVPGSTLQATTQPEA